MINELWQARSFDLKICFYTSTALPKRGGQEAVIDELARALSAMGHKVVVLAPQPRRPFKPRDEAFPYIVARHPRFYSTHRFVSWYRNFLLGLYRAEKFDLLHCHGIYPPGYIAALCRTAIPVPIVVTNHEGGLDEQNVRLAKPQIRSRYVDALTRADVLVALNHSAEEEYRRLCPAPPSIVRIPNGVDVQRWSTPQNWPVDLDDKVRAGNYVLYLGRLRHRKGVDCLLTAFAQVVNEGTWQLLVAGDGDDGPRLRTQARELGLADQCRFVGWVDDTAKAYLLQNALFTVIPSRLTEAFGLVALESYAAGRAVAASAVSGLKELVADGKTGVLFQPDSVPALVNALRAMLADPSGLQRMGAQARLWVEKFDWNSVARRHLELYQALLDGQRADIAGMEIGAVSRPEP